MKRFLSTTVALAVVISVAGAARPDGFPAGFEVQSLDGSGNNRAHPAWGQVGTNYSRVAPARYADGVGAPVAGPNARYLSNRVFNDTGQHLFSERAPVDPSVRRASGSRPRHCGDGRGEAGLSGAGGLP